MTKAEHAEIERFIDQRHDLRFVAGAWFQWTGRRWETIPAERVVAIYRTQM
jgi:hypothetical protein